MKEPDETPAPPSGGTVEAGDIEAAILGQQPRYDAAEVSELSGIPLEQARRLWRSLGFPEHGGAKAYTSLWEKWADFFTFL